MEWKVFQSSHLQAGSYDEPSRVLYVRFVNGSIYQYSGVPPTVADTLMQSSSSQEYFNHKIKGVYPYVKIADGTTSSGRRSRRRFT